MSAAGSAELVDKVIADPPGVHPGAPQNVWSTARDAYVLLADLVGPSTRSIETGCGSSTAVFALRQADHVCATLVQEEADAFLEWARRHDVDVGRVRFLIGPSERTLPVMTDDAFDLVFVDGNHSFPAPVVDWFYLVTKLKVGGVVFVDDVQLPAPRLVADYMDSLAPTWQRVQRTDKWAAFRLTDTPAPENWALPRAGSSLFGTSGRFEYLGRRADALIHRTRSRR